MTNKEIIGRPARIASISFPPETTFDDVIATVDREASGEVDLIALPETCRGQDSDSLETLDGQTISTLKELASRHNTYIVCGINRIEKDSRFNSSVLIDRKGRIVCVYDKVYPFWEELEELPPSIPGSNVPVYSTDLGIIGMAICFDVNFPEVWNHLAKQGCELVIWPSAYSGGSSLQAYAIMHHFYIVSSTWVSDCVVYDITGQELLYEKSKGINVSRITLDLDRAIYHMDFNEQKRDRLLAEHGDEVMQELIMEREHWFVLKAKKRNVSARELALQYGLEELRQYKHRSHTEIEHIRGNTIKGEKENG